MAYNFFETDREQQFLLPENMRDWLPEGDLALFVVDTVERLDLSEFYTRYRTDGWGAAAYDPRMMVALILYSYCVGERSSRRIEKLCERDVGFRVIMGNHVPDHSTIARFRRENEQAISSLFRQVLSLCAQAGMVKPGVIAIDGTKIKAQASLDANRTHASLEKEFEKLARRILEEADRVDEEEDRIYGPDKRGDEVPEHLRDEKKRQAWIKEKLDEMKRQAEEAAKEQEKKIEKREEKRKAGVEKKKLGGKPLPPEVARERFLSKAKVNTTDPESRIMKSSKGYVQGFNAQLAVTEDQIIVAADLTNQAADWHLLHPMVDLAKENLEKAGVKKRVETVVADAGYGCEENLKEAERLKEESLEEKESASCPDFFVATKKDRVLAREMAEAAAAEEGGTSASETAEEKAAEAATAAQRMEEKLKTKEGRETYAKRGKTIEPVFGQMKEVRRLERFMRRGLDACRSEWSLIGLSHNVLKLWRSGVAIAEIG